MATNIDMFDREELVRALDRDCFGAAGSSTVIVGGHKVGKTHLLKYLQARPKLEQQCLYCQLDHSALRAESNENPSDHDFLKFFLTRLLEQIETWIDKQQLDRGRWEEDLQRSNQRLTEIGGQSDGPTAASLRDTVDALAQKINQLNRLEKLAEEARKLLNRQDALKPYELAFLLTSLKRLNKHIILIIDEYDRFLKEPGFTSNLFNFLRGANNEGKIIALVSSNTNLMDSSLHPAIDVHDRKSLFNHFHNHFLVPFSETEAEGFLDWLTKETVPFTLEEKNYIRELGGGTPYFLRIACDKYLTFGRPLDAAGKRNLEIQYLEYEFREPFREMWDHANDSERQGLVQAAAGNSVNVNEFPRLEREGYLVRHGTEYRIFSRLFAEFINLQQKTSLPRSKPSSDLTPANYSPVPVPELGRRRRQQVIATVTPRFRVCPTALYVAASEFGETVDFKLENPTAETVKIQLFCQVLDYSNEIRQTCDIKPGETLRIPLILTFDSEKLSRLKKVTETNIRYSVVQFPGAAEETLIDNTDNIRLLPLDNFLMARLDPTTNRLRDYTWLIAAWINKDAEGLNAIFARAAQQLPGLGVPLMKGQKGRKDARNRVAILYQALQEEKINYSNSATVFHHETNDYLQRVRTPTECLDSKSANCLDGAVLFASLLDQCGLAPAILLLPGHALVGWKDESGLEPEWEFLETTVLSTGSFEEAFKSGQKQAQKAKPLTLKMAVSTDIIADPDRFAILIDINKIRSQQKILPIS